jgi:hypothetical protein
LAPLHSELKSQAGPSRFTDLDYSLPALTRSYSGIFTDPVTFALAINQRPIWFGSESMSDPGRISDVSATAFTTGTFRAELVDPLTNFVKVTVDGIPISVDWAENGGSAYGFNMRFVIPEPSAVALCVFGVLVAARRRFR